MNLLHFPSIISHQQLLEIVVFLFAFDFFDLFCNCIIVGRSIYIADYTECNREVGTFHQGQFQLKCIVLAVCIVDKNIFFCDTVFTEFHSVDGAASVEVLKAAATHKGASVVEVLQNCVIFNDGTHASVATKEGRAKNAIYLEHGKPMLFGENKEFGLMQEGFGLKVVKLGENGITEKDILIHDAQCQDNTPCLIK